MWRILPRRETICTCRWSCFLILLPGCKISSPPPLGGGRGTSLLPPDFLKAAACQLQISWDLSFVHIRMLFPRVSSAMPLITWNRGRNRGRVQVIKHTRYNTLGSLVLARPVCSEVEMLTVYPTSRFGTYLTSHNSQAKAKSKWNFVPQTAESKLEFCNASIEERSSQWRPIRSSSI